MEAAAVINASHCIALARWRELVLPREHGSWSFALEPLALGLLVAPSAAGADLAVAVVATFLARRPLRTALGEVKAEHRAAAVEPLVVLGAVALVFFLSAIALGGVAWAAWLAPSALGGTVFLGFDLRHDGRAEMAEVAGVAAFAFVPAAVAALAGWGNAESLALALIACGRSVPTMLCVRAAVRGTKTGVRRNGPALVATFLALAVATVLVRAGLAPQAAAVGLAILAVRAVVLLLWPRPALRARTLGMAEAGLGAFFVFSVAASWRA